MINREIEGKHLGGGVVLYEAAIDFDFDFATDTCREIVDRERSAMYKLVVHPETKRKMYLNKSGYYFEKEDIDKMPGRGSSAHQDPRPEVKELLNFLEKSKDHYLLKYFEMFPLAFKCVWWKVKSHIVSYEKNIYLGTHSDISADYVYGLQIPMDQLMTRSIISVIVYFNDSVDLESELDGKNFTGGHHYFNYLDIDYQPKRGDILFFPSNYMAAHEVKPVGAGTRFSYLGWYSQGTPNKEVGEAVVDPIQDPEAAHGATNLYMPELISDYKKFLIDRGHSKSSEQYSLIESGKGY